jgi:hypothetical protein
MGRSRDSLDGGLDFVKRPLEWLTVEIVSGAVDLASQVLS